MMQVRSSTQLILAAIAVHTILCYSVIDIHFQSPIISGVPPVPPGTVAPAKRLFFIVADGAGSDFVQPALTW
jgi:hypothetical protein